MGAIPPTLSEKRLAAIFLFIIFAQNPPWPIWEFQSTLVTLSVTLGLLLTMKSRLDYLRGGYLGFFAIVGGFLYFFLAHGLNGTFRLSSTVFILTLLLIFRSDTRTGSLAFNQISYVFAAMLLVSLVFWVLWQLGLSLPSTAMVYGSWKGDGGAIQLENFYFFISEGQTLINRFYGVFDEPGVVGTLAALVLCGLRFNFNLKRTWIIFAGGLFSWSLAFIMLTILGFFLFSKQGNIKLLAGGILALFF